jgi:hypothetical protein
MNTRLTITIFLIHYLFIVYNKFKKSLLVDYIMKYET